MLSNVKSASGCRNALKYTEQTYRLEAAMISESCLGILQVHKRGVYANNRWKTIKFLVKLLKADAYNYN